MKLALAQEEAESKEAKDSRAKVEEDERIELEMTDKIKELAIVVFDSKPFFLPSHDWLDPDPRAFPGKVLAGDLLEWVGLLWSLRGPLRNKYPECREIIDRLLAALQSYNDRRSARLHPSAEWSLHA